MSKSTIHNKRLRLCQLRIAPFTGRYLTIEGKAELARLEAEFAPLELAEKQEHASKVKACDEGNRRRIEVDE